MALATEAYGEAQQLLQESLAVYQEIGQREQLGNTLALLGVAARGLTQLSQARQHFCEALRIAAEIRDFIRPILALLLVSLLLADQGQVERAVELYALASCYPFVANSRWFEDITGRHIAAVAATLPPEVVAAVGQLQSVEDLAVMGGRWSQEDLLVFGKLTNLKRLRLGMHDTDLSDAVLVEIAKLKDLESLSLSGGAVSKRGLNQLNGLTKLHTLDVSVFSFSEDEPGIDETPLNLEC